VIYLGLWFYMQFFSGVLSVAGPEQVGGVAWWAHIGGFGAGALLLKRFLRPRPRKEKPIEAVITRKWR
jgi:membrane associated rhomboid family serine protease